MEELTDWLTLWRVPGIGPVRFHTLIERLGPPEEILNAPAGQITAAGFPPGLAGAIAGADRRRCEPDLDWLGKPDHEILTIRDPRYPSPLKEISHPPPILFVTGQCDCLNDPQLAIVGSRNPSPGGARNTREFAGELASAGLTITSGLARGVDGIAHEAVLNRGGVTIAVTATGPDRVYPARHRELAHRIAEDGAIVTEFPVGTPPRADRFPQRNRLISGLCLGALVTEAARRSGALITARHALEQGREVFAIPGSIHNPVARGCHSLIRQGAMLVESTSDILEELSGQIDLQRFAPRSEPEKADTGAKLGPDVIELLSSMGHDPVSVEDIVESSGLTPESVSSMLIMLELKGYVGLGSNGAYHRLRSD
ncbi:MAG: DNA-processing protein DprA [Gammaproteobacteria bacterium]|jgi:DNA processing protein|nr:DNA-processing protein DprA [Gammaproteobacteria bacterium]